MLESFRQLYDKIIEFCREQSDAVMIGGAVLVIFIILIAVIRIARKDGKDGEDLNFDEELYIKQLLEAKAAKETGENKRAGIDEAAEGKEEKKEAVEIHAPEAVKGTDGNALEQEAAVFEAELKPSEKISVPGREAETDIKPVEAEQPNHNKEVLCSEERENLLRECKKNVIFPEELIEEIAKASAKDLQEVQIKIQSAELRIRYVGYKDEKGLKEEVKRFSGAENEDRLAEEETLGAESEPAGEENFIEAESCSEQYGDSREVLKEKIIPEEIARFEDIKRYGKFGKDNFNTARSGRVFTEEELEKQIRD